MSDTPATPSSKGWTDFDKLDVLFQIISKMDKPIPWKQIEIPEGRTLKAVQVMVDKEKSKLKKAKEAAATGEDGETAIPATPAPKGKKRGAKVADIDEDEEPKAKKPKTPRKKKAKAGEDEETSQSPTKFNEMENDDGSVKAEPSGDEL